MREQIQLRVNFWDFYNNPLDSHFSDVTPQQSPPNFVGGPRVLENALGDCAADFAVCKMISQRDAQYAEIRVDNEAHGRRVHDRLSLVPKRIDRPDMRAAEMLTMRPDDLKIESVRQGGQIVRPHPEHNTLMCLFSPPPPKDPDLLCVPEFLLSRRSTNSSPR